MTNISQSFGHSIDPSDTRQAALAQWAEQKIIKSWCEGCDKLDLHWSIVSGDASFRRYFRFKDAVSGQTWICVDAPPEHENSPQFVKVANLLSELNAPRILAYDFEQGFMLLSDLGDQLLLPLLNEQTVDELYRKAIDGIIQMQKIDDAEQLPAYDKTLLHTEMELFREWFLGKHLNYSPSEDESKLLDETFERLSQSAQAQPQAFVHRDFHSRNIMLSESLNGKNDKTEIGIIDFQDAVYGPITYDLLSLLRDVYVQWPSQKVEQWLEYYLQKTPLTLEKNQFIQWFDYMGLQRHIKIAGIFCRLYYRDDKSGYLKDIPLTLKYILQQAEKYPELSRFYQWFQQVVMIKFEQKHQQMLKDTQ